MSDAFIDTVSLASVIVAYESDAETVTTIEDAQVVSFPDHHIVVVSEGVAGPPGAAGAPGIPGGAHETLIDTTDIFAIIKGIAPTGSAVTDPVWALTKLISTSSSPSVTILYSPGLHAWVDRVSAVYL